MGREGGLDAPRLPNTTKPSSEGFVFFIFCHGHATRCRGDNGPQSTPDGATNSSEDGAGRGIARPAKKNEKAKGPGQA